MESFFDGRIELHPGDCREVLKSIPDNSIDSVVTDPPYALVSIVKRFGGDKAKKAKAGKTGAYARASAGFMGKKWDTGETAFAVSFWKEVFRVLKPGGHVASFSGTRTYHRMAVAIEDAGFEVRDQVKWMHECDAERIALMDSLNDEQRAQFVKLFCESGELGQLAWVYGSGFPKSHDVSKGIDKAKGAKREKVRHKPRPETSGTMSVSSDSRPWIEESRANGFHEVAGPDPVTDEAKAAQGWGTALKPAWEPICLARKPLIGTGAQNFLEHGTGALNIDGCRVESGADEDLGRNNNARTDGTSYIVPRETLRIDNSAGKGRWPANIVHDGSDEVLAGFPDSGGGKLAVSHHNTSLGSSGSGVYGKAGGFDGISNFGDSGSAARFFYTAKADGDDRLGSKHPTVKPVDLMQWLCRLITPPGGTILDPFSGTGTTGEAAYLEGFRAVLVEREEEYQADIRKRMSLVVSSSEARKRAASKLKPETELGGIFEGLA